MHGRFRQAWPELVTVHDVTAETTSVPARGAIAAGLATIAADGTVLDTWFPAPALTDQPGPPAPSG